MSRPGPTDPGMPPDLLLDTEMSLRRARRLLLDLCEPLASGAHAEAHLALAAELAARATDGPQPAARQPIVPADGDVVLRRAAGTLDRLDRHLAAVTEPGGTASARRKQRAPSGGSDGAPQAHTSTARAERRVPAPCIEACRLRWTLRPSRYTFAP